ncbi:hypothetical protein SNEBB_005149 [Seison nebaliae]|nr:hypothetical protein SNEBB_005149 [Seison nebaliae]
MTFIERGIDCQRLQLDGFRRNIQENLPVNSTVGTVRLLNVNNGLPIKYSVEGTSFFTVHPQTGVIKLARNFDREAIPQQVRVTFVAENDGNRYVQRDIIKAIDFNDNRPLFTSLPFNINYNSNNILSYNGVQVEDPDLSSGQLVEISCDSNRLAQFPELINICNQIQFSTVSFSDNNNLMNVTLSSPNPITFPNGIKQDFIIPLKSTNVQDIDGMSDSTNILVNVLDANTVALLDDNRFILFIRQRPIANNNIIGMITTRNDNPILSSNNTAFRFERTTQNCNADLSCFFIRVNDITQLTSNRIPFNINIQSGASSSSRNAYLVLLDENEKLRFDKPLYNFILENDKKINLGTITILNDNGRRNLKNIQLELRDRNTGMISTQFRLTPSRVNDNNNNVFILETTDDNLFNLDNERSFQLQLVMFDVNNMTNIIDQSVISVVVGRKLNNEILVCPLKTSNLFNLNQILSDRAILATTTQGGDSINSVTTNIQLTNESVNLVSGSLIIIDNRLRTTNPDLLQQIIRRNNGSLLLETRTTNPVVCGGEIGNGFIIIKDDTFQIPNDTLGTNKSSFIFFSNVPNQQFDLSSMGTNFRIVRVDPSTNFNKFIIRNDQLILQPPINSGKNRIIVQDQNGNNIELIIAVGPKMNSSTSTLPQPNITPTTISNLILDELIPTNLNELQQLDISRPLTNEQKQYFNFFNLGGYPNAVQLNEANGKLSIDINKLNGQQIIELPIFVDYKANVSSSPFIAGEMKIIKIDLSKVYDGQTVNDRMICLDSTPIIGHLTKQHKIGSIVQRLNCSSTSPFTYRICRSNSIRNGICIDSTELSINNAGEIKLTNSINNFNNSVNEYLVQIVRSNDSSVIGSISFLLIPDETIDTLGEILMLPSTNIELPFDRQEMILAHVYVFNRQIGLPDRNLQNQLVMTSPVWNMNNQFIEYIPSIGIVKLKKKLSPELENKTFDLTFHLPNNTINAATLRVKVGRRTFEELPPFFDKNSNLHKIEIPSIDISLANRQLFIIYLQYKVDQRYQLKLQYTGDKENMFQIRKSNTVFSTNLLNRDSLLKFKGEYYILVELKDKLSQKRLYSLNKVVFSSSQKKPLFDENRYSFIYPSSLLSSSSSSSISMDKTYVISADQLSKMNLNEQLEFGIVSVKLPTNVDSTQLKVIELETPNYISNIIQLTSIPIETKLSNVYLLTAKRDAKNFIGQHKLRVIGRIYDIIDQKSKYEIVENILLDIRPSELTSTTPNFNCFLTFNGKLTMNGRIFERNSQYCKTSIVLSFNTLFQKFIPDLNKQRYYFTKIGEYNITSQSLLKARVIPEDSPFFLELGESTKLSTDQFQTILSLYIDINRYRMLKLINNIMIEAIDTSSTISAFLPITILIKFNTFFTLNPFIANQLTDMSLAYDIDKLKKEKLPIKLIDFQKFLIVWNGIDRLSSNKFLEEFSTDHLMSDSVEYNEFLGTNISNYDPETLRDILGIRLNFLEMRKYLTEDHLPITHPFSFNLSKNYNSIINRRGRVVVHSYNIIEAIDHRLNISFFFYRSLPNTTYLQPLEEETISSHLNDQQNRLTIINGDWYLGLMFLLFIYFSTFLPAIPKKSVMNENILNLYFSPNNFNSSNLQITSLINDMQYSLADTSDIYTKLNEDDGTLSFYRGNDELKEAFTTEISGNDVFNSKINFIPYDNNQTFQFIVNQPLSDQTISSIINKMNDDLQMTSDLKLLPITIGVVQNKDDGSIENEKTLVKAVLSKNDKVLDQSEAIDILSTKSFEVGSPEFGEVSDTSINHIDSETNDKRHLQYTDEQILLITFASIILTYLFFTLISYLCCFGTHSKYYNDQNVINTYQST